MDIFQKSEPISTSDDGTFGCEGTFKVDKPVGAMSISPCGRDVVLASRQGLHVIDLDNPFGPPRHLPHYTPWEVADVQWSPFAIRDYWVVSTSNQKALVWNLMMNDARSAVEHYLHAHTRAITDINFSAHHPDILATCAVDSFVHCWDLRRPARPVLSFADWFAGATQVKWNRQDSHVIASSHDKTLRIWDDRNGAHPLQSIEAHDTKIYGLDWNRIRTTALITCSLDKTIKFWDYSVDTQKPERIIETSFPIWRARHTPFGHGVLAMPQRDDNDLYLYDRRASTPTHDISTPVKSFQGHEGQVKEFLWRCRGSVDSNRIDHREFQLVTWGADRTLRLHPMDDTTLAEVGYIRNQKSHERLHLTRSNAKYKTFRNASGNSEFRTVKSSSSLHDQLGTTQSFDIIKSGMTLWGRSAGAPEGFLDAKNSVRSKAIHERDLDPISWMKGVKVGKKELHPDQNIETDGSVDHRLHRGSEEFESLGEEITHIGTKFKNVKFNHIDVKERYVQFSLRGTWEKDTPTHLECQIEFPEEYPMLSAPLLTLEKTALSDKDTLRRIEEDIQAIGNAYVRLGRSSLEAIIRHLHGDESLEDALRWTTRELGNTMIDIGPADESSSDEDDIGQLGEDRESEFGLADSGLFGQPNVNAHMPLAKGCAAVWCENGTLVCFFPAKAKPMTLAGSLGSHRQSGLLRGKRKGLLGPFGRFTSSSHSESKVRSISSLDGQEPSSESEFSDSEYSSSASSAYSYGTNAIDVVTIAQHVFDVDRFELSKHGSERVPDGTLQSADSLNGSNFRGSSPKSILTIHDCRYLLPTKKELAAEYVCSGPDACRNNATVARKYGDTTIAEVWGLLDLILCDRFVTLSRTIPTPDSSPKRALSRNIDVKIKRSLNNYPREHFSQAVDFVRWSSHPFGGRLLIKRLFEYYAGLADIQMLAMMSSILSERDQSLAALQAMEGYELSTDSKSSHGQGPFSIIKSSERMSSESNGFKRRASSLRSPMKPNHDTGLLSSSFETVINNGGSLESSGPDTTLNRSFEGQTSTSKLSSSPEWIRPLHKSGTNLANAIMALPLSFSLTTSAAPSPPTVSFMKKKVSPIGSLSATSGLRAGDSSAYGVSYSRSNSTKNSDGRLHAIRQQPSTTKVARGMTFKLKSRQGATYPGNTENEPLLDPSMAPLYQTWRDEYAELLLNWDLLIPHAEMRKNNGLSSHNTSQATNTDKQSFMTGTDLTVKYSVGDTRGVLAITHCRFCDNAPQRQSNESICRNCYGSYTTICALCNLPVHGRSSPCFTCGHVLHISCRETWEYHYTGTSCPTGCGCVCSAPTIPSEGIVRFHSNNHNNDDISHLLSSRSSRFTSSHLSFPTLRSSSPTASTIRDFNHNSIQDHHSTHRHPSTTSGLQSNPITAGTQTPRSSTSQQPSHAIAYATLQSLAAQSRPRGDTTGGNNTRHASTTTTTTAATDKPTNKSAKLRPSKSLMFSAAGFGNSSNTNSTTGSTTHNTENKKTRPSGTTGNNNSSSSSRVTFSASGSSSSSVLGKSRRHSSVKGGGGSSSSAAGSGKRERFGGGGGGETPMQHEDGMDPFDWGLGETDDSDV